VETGSGDPGEIQRHSIRKSVATRSREVIPHLYSALVEATCGMLCPLLGSPVQQRDGVSGESKEPLN